MVSSHEYQLFSDDAFPASSRVAFQNMETSFETVWVGLLKGPMLLRRPLLVIFPIFEELPEEEQLAEPLTLSLLYNDVTYPVPVGGLVQIRRGLCNRFVQGAQPAALPR